MELNVFYGTDIHVTLTDTFLNIDVNRQLAKHSVLVEVISNSPGYLTKQTRPVF